MFLSLRDALYSHSFWICTSTIGTIVNLVLYSQFSSMPYTSSSCLASIPRLCEQRHDRKRMPLFFHPGDWVWLLLAKHQFKWHHYKLHPLRYGPCTILECICENAITWTCLHSLVSIMWWMWTTSNYLKPLSWMKQSQCIISWIIFHIFSLYYSLIKLLTPRLGLLTSNSAFHI